jgi:hypothetical protein
MPDEIDEALKSSGLKIYSDPRTQDDLVMDVLQGADPVRILNEYEYWAERVRCAICPKHQHHNRGITVEFDDGSKALCGSVCAEKLYGKDVWNRIQNEFADRRSAELQASLIGPTRDLIVRIRRDLSPLLSLYQHGEKFTTWLRGQDPHAYNALKSAARTGTPSLVLAAKQQEIPFLGGPYLLAVERKLHSVLGQILRDLDTALAAGTDRQNLKEISKLRSDLRTTLVEFLAACSALKALLDERALFSISSWASQLSPTVPHHFFSRKERCYSVKGNSYKAETFTIDYKAVATEVIDVKAIWD